jgi:hypothetical protein
MSDIEGDRTFLNAFLPYASRIAHLSLTECSSIEAVAKLIPSFFASTMHALTSLELQQTAEPLEPELFPSDELIASPISWELPNLKSLRLTRTPLYPALIRITSLVELKLVGYTTLFRFWKLIWLMRSNPNLELIVLDLQFAEAPTRIFLAGVVSLCHLRQLSFTCASAIDAKGLISSISFPRGVFLEVSCPQADQHADLRSFLPSPPTRIQELLTPITTIKYQNAPSSREFHLSGNNSLFSFRRQNVPFNLDPEFFLFTTTSVREFHAKVSPSREALFRPLSRLPALETLVLLDVASFPPHSLDFLAEEPVLCPSLKTIAFFDCDLGSRTIGELEEIVARRKNSTAAWLHRVVIVRRVGKLPDHKLIRRLRQSVPRVDARIDEELPELP